LIRFYINIYKLDFVEFLIAISVTSHGDIREKLNMAFNMYGKYQTREVNDLNSSDNLF
jgi:Ca2+-binding EF-hand superfamily protein